MIRSMTKPLATLALLTLSIAAGCDDTPPPPVTSGETSAPAPGTPGSTAGLPTSPADNSLPLAKDAQWKRTPLLMLPLTAELPPGWSINTDMVSKDGLPTLEGPVPHMDYRPMALSLKIGSPITPDALQILRDEDKKAVGQPPEEASGSKLLSVDYRERDGMKIYERLETSVLKGDAENAESLEVVRWQIRFLVPEGVSYASYELMLSDLSTLEEFRANEEFLRDIISRIKPADATEKGLL